jgi:hypothetical protein
MMVFIQRFSESWRHQTRGQSVRIHAPQGKEAVRLRVRERLEQYRIDDAENCRRRADTERQRNDRGSRKHRMIQQLPNRELDVASKVGKVSHHPFIPFKSHVDVMAFRHNRVMISELSACFCCSSLGRPTAFNEFARPRFNMEFHFIAQIAVDIPTPKN